MNKKMLISLVHHAGNMSLETSSGSISSVNNLLILVTAAGQITGTLLQKENDSDPKEQIADAIFLSAANTLANHAEMIDLRNYAELIRQFVKKEDEKDQGRKDLSGWMGTAWARSTIFLR